MPKQQLGLGGAVAIGLASMLGAGVFVVFSEAYRVTLNLLVLGIALAALVAILNAASIFQLASQVDRPGGVYAYARVYLSESWSFAAGFAFVVGKIASIAAIAIVFQKYVFPQIAFWPSALAIAILSLINILGINRTALAATVLSLITVSFFVVLTILGITDDTDLSPSALSQSPQEPLTAIALSAGIIFFAFAGYARVATLGDEVRDPKRNIPRAIVISLGTVLIIYIALAWALLRGLGSEVAQSQTPVADLFQNLVGVSWVTPAVAALACLGSMLALLAGVSRTAATMSEDGEIPDIFKHRNRFHAPWVSESVIALLAVGLASVGDLVLAVGFSSISVLFYYSVGHLASIAQPKGERLMPRWLNIVGLTLCLLLGIAFGPETLIVSASTVLLALSSRWLWRRLNPR
jgi:APA family basic amino acid/polyamine antiporter